MPKLAWKGNGGSKNADYYGRKKIERLREFRSEFCEKKEMTLLSKAIKQHSPIFDDLAHHLFIINQTKKLKFGNESLATNLKTVKEMKTWDNLETFYLAMLLFR